MAKIHPTGIALGASADGGPGVLALGIDALLDWHRAVFGAARMEGDDGTDGGDGSADGADGTDGDRGGADSSEGMTWNELKASLEGEGLTPAQIKGRLEASRKWEKRARGLDSQEMKDLREKAAKHDALERELMSDKDKAVAEAKDLAKAEILAATTPKLVAAEFKVVAAGRIEADRLATILEPLDLTKFLTDDGEVDTDKVSKFVDGIAPAKGDDKTKRRGPTSTGHGARGDSTTAGGSVASGRDLYRDRHNRKTA